MGNALPKRSEEGVGSTAAETFDGGGFDSGSVYPNQPQDHDRKIVRKLIVERKLSPLYKGLASADDLPPGAAAGEGGVTSAAGASGAAGSPGTAANGNELAKHPSSAGEGAGASRAGTSPSTAPHAKRASFHARLSASGLPSGSLPLSSSGIPRDSLRRSNSYSNTVTTSAASSSVQINPIELYKNPVECPICFLYYPSNINYSRCCDQPVCTECFLQMKRSEVTNTPVECPFCCEPNFGIIYEPPEFVRSQDPPSQQPSEAIADALTRSASSLPATGKNPSPLRARRKNGLSSTDPSVVTCDDVRPDFMRRYIEARYRSNAAVRRPLVTESVGGWRTLIRQPAPNARRPMTSDYAGYLRGMGAELEELMVLEAVRLSLLDEDQRQAQARQEAETEASAILRSSQELGPPATSRADDSASADSSERMSDSAPSDTDGHKVHSTLAEAEDGDRLHCEDPPIGSDRITHTGVPVDDDDTPILQVLTGQGANVVPFDAPALASDPFPVSHEPVKALGTLAAADSEQPQQQSQAGSSSAASAQLQEIGASGLTDRDPLE